MAIEPINNSNFYPVANDNVANTHSNEVGNANQIDANDFVVETSANRANKNYTVDNVHHLLSTLVSEINIRNERSEFKAIDNVVVRHVLNDVVEEKAWANKTADSVANIIGTYSQNIINSQEDGENLSLELINSLTNNNEETVHDDERVSTLLPLFVLRNNSQW